VRRLGGEDAVNEGEEFSVGVGYWTIGSIRGLWRAVV